MKTNCSFRVYCLVSLKDQRSCQRKKNSEIFLYLNFVFNIYIFVVIATKRIIKAHLNILN